MRHGKAEQSVLKDISVFRHLHGIVPKQLCALAQLGFTREVSTSK